MAKDLTAKQEKFCQVYVQLGNASEAYRQAYDVSPTTKDSTIWRKAVEVLENGKVSARMAQLQTTLGKRHDISKDKIVKMYMEIIADSTETFELGRTVTEDKKEIQRFYRMAQVTSNGDKIKALDSLSKMLGLNEPTDINLNIIFSTNWGI